MESTTDSATPAGSVTTQSPEHVQPPPSTDKPQRIRRMFAAIVPRYDLINRLMTLGLDRRWRRLTVAAIQPRDVLMLDIATGTGDLALEGIRQGVRRAVGVDFCPEMVIAAQAKASRQDGLAVAGRVDFMVGDAMRLPFPDATFDAIVNGFMLRNVADLNATFAELCRVLKPDGRLGCLDLTPPRGLLRHFFSVYIATVVPLLGICLAGNYRAYRYLFQSLQTHPAAGQVASMMRAAGFREAGYKLIGFGTVAIHLGRK